VKSRLVRLASLLAIAVAWQLWASAAQTLSDTDPGPKTYTVTFTSSNPSATASLQCNAAAPCDDTALTVTLPAGYVAAHPRARVGVVVSWTDADPTGNSPRSDYDLYIYNGNPPSGGIAWSSAGVSNPEQTSIFPLADGTKKYTIRVVPFAAKAETVTIRIELVPGSGSVSPGPCDAIVFGDADLPCPGTPRYQIFVPPTPSSANAGSGEYNIGYNPHTGRIINMNIGPIWRVTPAEIKTGGAKDPPLSSGLPESCPEVWENVSDPRTNNGVDPILWTDGGFVAKVSGVDTYVKKSGRTFATNSTAGGALLYTDTDGGDPPANNQANSAWVESAQPPNGGADHEGIGSGPFPALMAALGTPANQGEWVLFCSQDLVAPSMCQRSLTLGATWENGFPATGFGCAGLHGHPRVAPDGSAWLPVKSCGTAQGGSITIDTSTSPWTEFLVKKTAADADGPAFIAVPQGNGADPSIAFDSNSTAYYCYVNGEANGNEGHVHVAVGKRQGTGTTIKWIRDVDVGASHGIVNAAHTEAIGGSAGRAACGFLGTDQVGNYQAGTYVGMNWYVFMAATYDEGKTWVTVNATPNDPVQHNTGIWQQGGGGQNGNRNLLDFNEISLDDKGRPLYGYSDGCTTNGCVALTNAQNDKTAFMRVARQIGGKSLLASYDSATDTNDGLDNNGPINPKTVTPKRACLLDAALGHKNPSTRDTSAAHLKWKAPDHGGAPILNYDIYRGTSQGGPYSLIGSTPDAKPVYDDATSGDTIPDLYYIVKANTASLASAESNEVKLSISGGPVVENVCVIPGLTILTDATGDALDGLAAHDAQSLKIAEPYFGPGPDKLVFTLKVASLSPAPPGDTYWPVQFNVGATTYTARMSTFAPGTPATPVFEYFQGTWNTIVVNPPMADPLSSFSPDGTIRIVVPRSGVGNPAIGSNLTSFLTRIAVNAGGVLITPDNMPDNFMGAGSYAVVGNLFCRPNEAPFIDTFDADPRFGESPLTVSFSATAHDDDTAAPADTIAAWHLDFGDGNTVTLTSPPVNLTHTYSTPNDKEKFVARLTVTDSRGKDSIGELIEIEVENPLVPRLSAPATAAKGEPVTLDGSASTAPEGETIVEYDFDFDDGTPMEIGPASSVQHVYTVGGSKEASLRVRNNNGELSTSAATAVIDVINRAPVAQLVADQTSGNAPLTVTFDGSGSSDPDTTDYVSMYDLDFGDGALLQGQLTPFAPRQHTYTQPGYYNVLLRVYDNEFLASASDSLVQIEVPNRPPVAAMTATPSTQGKNRVVTFDASASSDAEGPLLYAFDFGDGASQSGSASSVTHAYSQAGVYTATVTVTDSSLDARSATQSVTITNAAPVAVLTASETQIPPYGAVNFSGAGSTDADVGDAVQTYTFTFGDGTPAVTQTRASVVHAYTAVGDYEASLIVTDKDGEASDRQVLPIKVSVGDNTQVLTGRLSPWMLLVLGFFGALRRAVRPRSVRAC
jgi:PKD repeat protein